MDQLFTKEDLKDALMLKANYFQTSYIENKGGGKFVVTPLPMVVQESPSNGMIVDDIDLDGNLDVMIIGNDFGNEVFIGRFDASHGVVLLGDGRGAFRLAQSRETGLNIPGDTKALVAVNTPTGDLFVATRNRDSVRVFARTAVDKRTSIVPKPLDRSLEIRRGDGGVQKFEIYYGSGYLSQSSRRIRLPRDAAGVTVLGSDGKVRTLSQK